MTPRLCKYECGVMLNAWDDQAHKYRELETNELHTKERCEEAKAKLAQKNDHGNELVIDSGRDIDKLIQSSPTQDAPPPRPPGFPIDEPFPPVTSQQYIKDHMPKDYVDHTAAKPSEVKIFFSQYPADVEKEYKEFQIGKKFAWARAQYQLERDEDNKVLFTICFFYEEK